MNGRRFNRENYECSSTRGFRVRHAARHCPDHLAAIDGLTRIRPRRANGVYFALGHGLVVIPLAVGIGHFLAHRFSFVGPWSLILIGAVNAWRLALRSTFSLARSNRSRHRSHRLEYVGIS